MVRLAITSALMVAHVIRVDIHFSEIASTATHYVKVANAIVDACAAADENEG